ncbi:hypothetical protein C2G38_2224116 [Gigaspora rosea]|uniref:Uncharacterized protein n=1 Tax=Gigaspora rosea TaxID=44941 RepID=A0A397U0F7_9GLOM|nr:hypothetical protein C2G38_2224116 [Gigaspora rosea]
MGYKQKKSIVKKTIKNSDDDSVVSSHKEFYSFISKSQSNKGKQPVRRRRNSQYPIILENLFFDEEENIAKDLLDLEDEELTDQEIDFNSPETLYTNIEIPIELINLNKDFVWMILERRKIFLFSYFIEDIRKALGVCVHMIKYAKCEQCCKLYNTADVSTDKPNMVPKGFEESCRKWAKRYNDAKRITNIYDRRIWKTFQDPNEDLLFFWKELSDGNLGLMINLDWFQPFDNSQYSVRAIYGVICNLPRDERFKSLDIITLALIPGIELDSTSESPTGKFIRAVVICCSCDIPATRKLFGHISARIACHSVMTLFAVIVALELRESSNVAFIILFENWNDSGTENSLLDIFNGVCIGFLGMTGIETSCNYIEDQKPVTTILPLSTFKENPNNIFSILGDHAAGNWLKIFVIIDAVISLYSGVLTGFVGITGLIHRMASDQILPQFLLNQNQMEEMVVRRIEKLKQQPIIFFTKADELYNLNKAQRAFNPKTVDSISKHLQIPKSFMFIKCPGSNFLYKIAEFGSVRIIH